MKEKILIVEDDKDIIKMLEYNLKKEGFKVIAAHVEGSLFCGICSAPEACFQGSAEED